MQKSNFMLIALAGILAVAITARAQNTFVYAPPPPATTLEILETNTGTILVKATSLIGSLSADGATVSVTCKEDTETSTGRREYGISLGVALAQTANLTDRTIVDYDELGSLLGAIDEIAKMDWSVTSLASFRATYQTKGGFIVAAFGDRRSGGIAFSMRSSRMSKGIVLTQSQLAVFRGLIDQARRAIDGLRAK